MKFLWPDSGALNGYINKYTDQNNVLALKHRIRYFSISNRLLHLRVESTLYYIVFTNEQMMMKVLHVSFQDDGGGAAKGAYRLHTSMLSENVDSKLLVIRKKQRTHPLFKYHSFTK